MKAGEARGITMRRLDFSDPQGGKGSCDGKAATIKANIKVRLNEGHGVETASQMIDVMQSSGGVSGLFIRLCDRVVSSPVLQIKLDGVSTIANVERDRGRRSRFRSLTSLPIYKQQACLQGVQRR